MRLLALVFACAVAAVATVAPVHSVCAQSSDREAILKQIADLREKLAKTEAAYLAPSPEDTRALGALANDPNAGVIRILTRVKGHELSRS
jgi:hypothetical protein